MPSSTNNRPNSDENLIQGSANNYKSAAAESNSSVGNLQTYSEEQVKEKLNSTGRFAMQTADLEMFDSDKYEDPLEKVANETVWDKNNIPYIMRTTETGEIVPKSAVKEMYDMFKNLEDLGVLDSAYAFGINGKIYNLYFDLSKKWVSINPELLFDPMYRYYAIRNSQRNENGGFDYLTGVYARNPKNGEMELLTPYADMDIIPNPSGDGTQVSKPRQTALIGEMTNGGKYVVEFLDEDKVIRSSEVFQAISVKALDYSLAPDQTIIGLIVKPNNEMPDGDSCFVYSNDDPKQVLNFRVFLKYADDTLIDITDQQFTNQRLVISGLDSINTGIITNDENPPQTIDITYYLSKDNSSYDEGELPEGGSLDIGTLSITKHIKVYVRESIFDDVVNVVPAGWITYPAGNPNQKILLKMYGVYKSGTLKDITNYVSTNNRFSGFASGTSIYDRVLNAFTASSQYIGAVPETLITKVPQGRGTTLQTFQHRFETATSHRRLIINNEPSVFIRFNPNTKRMTFDGTQTVEKLKELNTFTKDNINRVPTHFNVRSAIDPAIVVAKNVPIESALTGFTYSSYLDDVLTTDYPFIVEFMYIDIIDGMISTVFTTNASRYYANRVTA